MRLGWATILVFAWLGCAAEDRGRGGTPGIGGGPSGADGALDSGIDPSDGDDEPTGGEATSGGDDDPLDGNDDGLKFDLNVPPGGDAPPVEPGCHKIDFLFVVDNSQSMEDDQDNPVANFPSFIEGIQSALSDEVTDYHVGVITSDAYIPNAPGCNVLGGLVTKTGGTASSAAACGPYAEGFNFMTEQDDLGSAFACAAKVGAGGWPIEKPMNALEAAVRGDNSGNGGCNTGFLRSDALLVAVIITDEWDGPGDPELLASMGGPQQWYDTVVAAKGGENNAAIVSLVNYQGGPCEPSEPVWDGQRIVEFTNLFGANGFVGGVCEPDYGPIFEQAIGLVDEACDGFVRPG